MDDGHAQMCHPRLHETQNIAPDFQKSRVEQLRRLALRGAAEDSQRATGAVPLVDRRRAADKQDPGASTCARHGLKPAKLAGKPHRLGSLFPSLLGRGR